jgi:hypothetical protein
VQPAHPLPFFDEKNLVEFKWSNGKAPTIYVPAGKCLSAMAYLEYFPTQSRRGRGLHTMVSRAILSCSPGWCGTFGAGVDDVFSLDATEGNYDLTQMYLLPIAYRHYDDLSPAARDHLITQLLGNGRIHRPRLDDTFTSRGNPNDWGRAGFVSPLGYKQPIGETENHILMIVTARYLTNQLLHQRRPSTDEAASPYDDPGSDYDNRRNGGEDYPSCTALLLFLLRNMIKGDFSEYNAKSYQSETRWALLNLSSFAYDHEVRLGARMVLDYLSAHMAVSSNDLRRLLPFRRRFEDEQTPHTDEGYMTVGLVDGQSGADPASSYFAMQAGNLRAYFDESNGRVAIPSSGIDIAIEVLGDYRLPASIADLFVNDVHRRFFQRLHRTVRDDLNGNRNCDNMEIFAASPSYLITAGGQPATWAVDPGTYGRSIDGDKVAQALGAAVTTSFMPTRVRGRAFAVNASDLIQFGEFSTKTVTYTTHEGAGAAAGAGLGAVIGGATGFWAGAVIGAGVGAAVGYAGGKMVRTNTAEPKQVYNYGVAPDFACGHQVRLPAWINESNSQDVDGRPVDPHKTAGFSFVGVFPDAGRVSEDRATGLGNTDLGPGYLLAIYQQTVGGLALLEAFDYWIQEDHEMTVDAFRAGVLGRNGSLSLQSNAISRYVTTDGTALEFVIWNNNERHSCQSGAEVLSVSYGHSQSQWPDGLGAADTMPAQLLNGTIMNSRGLDEAVVEISNPQLGTTITLDFSDERHPSRRDTGTGEFEVAGFNNEVWLDFDYGGSAEGDVCRPFNTIPAAVEAVAERGVIRVIPGATSQRGSIGGGKRFTIVAPIGGVTIGGAGPAPAPSAEDGGEVSDRNVWVQFGWHGTGDATLDVPYLYGSLSEAIRAVADDGIVNIEPGATAERGPLSSRRRCRLVAPIGGVTIGAS